MSRLNSILAIALAIFWTLFIFFMVSLAGVKEEKLIDQIARSQAESLFQIMVDMRSWAADQGGVYVVPSEKTPPNPYLDHPRRDVQTSDGMQLTMINPAYMTRQISEIGLKRRGVKVRLTSLRPIRPDNAAKGWEKTALEGFEGGEQSFTKIARNEEGKYVFRYMAPLPLEEACNKCHISSHSAKGIRGGIGITFPVDDLVRSRTHIMRLNRTTFASIWLIGLFTIAGLAMVMDKVRGNR